MSNWALVESVDGRENRGSSVRFGALWEMLQGEKEAACRELMAAGPLLQADSTALNEREFSEEWAETIEWRHREQLERRLRDIIDAQDRLADGLYGKCADCGIPIESMRLAADPTATLCVVCKNSSEPEVTFHTM